MSDTYTYHWRFCGENIVLTGFMGTGKSSVGKELSTIRNIPFIDTDEEITKKFGPISELFENHGEEFFGNVNMKLFYR